MERTVDKIIAALDAIDAHFEDLEEDEDLEDSHDAEDDRTDLEPSLGAPENHPKPGGWGTQRDCDQTWWGSSSLNDLEENADDMPQADGVEDDMPYPPSAESAEAQRQTVDAAEARLAEIIRNRRRMEPEPSFKIVEIIRPGIAVARWTRR